MGWRQGSGVGCVWCVCRDWPMYLRLCMEDECLHKSLYRFFGPLPSSAGRVPEVFPGQIARGRWSASCLRETPPSPPHPLHHSPAACCSAPGTRLARSRVPHGESLGVWCDFAALAGLSRSSSALRDVQPAHCLEFLFQPPVAQRSTAFPSQRTHQPAPTLSPSEAFPTFSKLAVNPIKTTPGPNHGRPLGIDKTQGPQ